VTKMAEHLREVARAPVRGDRLALRGDRAVVGSIHTGEPHELTVVDLTAIAAPRIVSCSPFEYQIQAVTVVDDVAYAFEYRRAIHLVRLDERPRTFDCHLMFKEEVYEFYPVGKRWLLAARNWSGVTVFDIADPASPREQSTLKLGESCVEALAIVGERIFAAGSRDGLVELQLAEDGTLSEVARWLGGEDGFSVETVFAIGDRLWVFGNGTFPFAKADEDKAREEDIYEEPEGDPNCVVFALSDLETPLWFGDTTVKPRQLRGLPDGRAIALDSGKCFVFPPAGKPELLFRDRDLDVRAWDLHAGHIVALVDQALAVFAIEPSSPLAALTR
jgi:hypothetical protein